MRLTSTGLGIGTSSPSEKLEVVGVAKIRTSGGSGVQIVSAATPYIQAFGASGNNILQLNGQSISFWSGASYGAESEKMRLDSSGNLGLGVTPSAWTTYPALEISNVGTVGFNGRYGNFAANAYFASSFWRYSTSTGNACLHQLDDGAYKWFNAPSGTAGNAITFTQAMTLDASGNLGVGVTNPSQRLHIQDATQIRGVVSTGANSFQFWKDSTPSFAAAIGCGTPSAGLVSALVFETFSGSWAERARIDSSGNLLVGTTSANGAKFQVEHTGNSEVAWFTANNASFTDNVLRLDCTRNTTNSTWNFLECTVPGISNRLFIRDSGDVVNVNNSYGAISDAKLKENIVDATPKLEKLNQVRVVNFNMLGSEQKQIGVIAQELEQVFPGMVSESPDRDVEGNDLGTTTKAVKYSVFVPMLIKAIQEQQALIESLTTRVSQLEGTQP
ncbi:tail fiber domain-containing protein [bacterium]|nr:tail fiber domain-containing protein [bacterium]